MTTTTAGEAGRLEELPELLNTVDLARLFRVHRATVFRWLQAGKLPAVRIGKAYWTTRTALREAGLPVGPLEGDQGGGPVENSHAGTVAGLAAGGYTGGTIDES